jgi:hypothetical protein
MKRTKISPPISIDDFTEEVKSFATKASKEEVKEIKEEVKEMIEMLENWKNKNDTEKEQSKRA